MHGHACKPPVIRFANLAVQANVHPLNATRNPTLFYTAVLLRVREYVFFIMICNTVLHAALNVGANVDINHKKI